MSKIRFAEGLKVLPLVVPVAFTSSAVASEFVDMQLINWASFLVSFGVMTSDTTDTVTLTVEVCDIGTTTDSTETAVGYSYRLSSAVATDLMGAVTAVGSTGVAVNANADDAKVVIIDVNPAATLATLATARWIRIVATPVAEVASGVLSVIAVLEPKYPGTTIPSDT